MKLCLLDLRLGRVDLLSSRVDLVPRGLRCALGSFRLAKCRVSLILRSFGDCLGSARLNQSGNGQDNCEGESENGNPEATDVSPTGASHGFRNQREHPA